MLAGIAALGIGIYVSRGLLKGKTLAVHGEQEVEKTNLIEFLTGYCPIQWVMSCPTQKPSADEIPTFVDERSGPSR